MDSFFSVVGFSAGRLGAARVPTGLLRKQLEDFWAQVAVMATGPVSPDQQLLVAEPL